MAPATIPQLQEGSTMAVSTTPEIFCASIVLEKADEYRPADSYVVWTNWTGVDRPRTHGISCGGGPKGLKLAERLVAAIMAGRVFTNPEIKTDVYGQTYVGSDCAVFGRRLNADLTRLGF